jgi:hypothetical protein
VCAAVSRNSKVPDIKEKDGIVVYIATEGEGIQNYYQTSFREGAEAVLSQIFQHSILNYKTF